MQVQTGRWFAEHFRPGMHIRRLHYQLADIALRDDGEMYRNDKPCYARLHYAAMAARHLGYVKAEDFRDARNDPIETYETPLSEHDAPSTYWQPPVWLLPSIPNLNPGSVVYSGGAVGVDGYGYDRGDQPAWVEVWIEKSTMNDILRPLCRQLGVNLLVGKGYESITQAVQTLMRAQAAGKPVRILYISDYDPAGLNMPVSLSRQMEFYRRTYAPDVDMKLRPLVLTSKQVEEFALPSAPESSNVELDALEALYPGRLAQIVREAITPYRDDSLHEQLEEIEGEAVQAASEAWDADQGDIKQRWSDLRDRVRDVIEPFEARLIALQQEVRTAMQPFREEQDALMTDLHQAWEDFEAPDLPDRPEAADLLWEPDDEWLYDSTRDYAEQLDFYKQHKQNGDEP